MSEKLKPCPFCGGEAVICSGSFRDGGYVANYAYVECSRCEAKGEEFIECMPVDDVEMMAANVWNRRDERTCRQIVDGETASCSECGERMTSFSLHCPSCGARVVVDNADR